MTFENILVEIKSAIALITINRSKKLNALNKDTIKELHEALKKLENQKSIKVIIITGAGDKAFVAGADISEFAHFDKSQAVQLALQGQELLFNLIDNLSTPVIAAINGFALGGGLELAMSAHFRIACESAKMGLPEVSLGLIPGYGGTQRLAQLIGKGKAMELILTANMIDAKDALKLGLINYITPKEKLLELAYKIASKISQNSSSAISAAIESINAGYIYSKNGFETEIKNFGTCFETSDFKEGTCAFIEKRKAYFE